MQVEDYSEKAIIVRGDTKPFKEQLKGLGCKWNGSLGGWIASKTRRASIEAFINSNPAMETSVPQTAVPQTPPASSSEDPQPPQTVINKPPPAPIKVESMQVVFVSGPTFKIKEKIKTVGGVWCPPLGKWMFIGKTEDEVKAIL